MSIHVERIHTDQTVFLGASIEHPFMFEGTRFHGWQFTLWLVWFSIIIEWS